MAGWYDVKTGEAYIYLPHKTEEATVRLDNLAVARKMEEEFNDKKSRVEKLRASNPDAVNFNNEYELNRDAAKRWMKGNLRGEYVNADTGEKIEVSKVGTNKVTSHGERDKAHLMSIVAIPSLIEKSIFIEERPNEKGNDKYDSCRYYVCGVKINGEDYTAKVVIGVKDGSKYYDHLLTQIEKGTLIDNLNGIAKSVAENQNADVSVGKDTKWLSILQTNDVQNAEKTSPPQVGSVEQTASGDMRRRMWQEKITRCWAKKRLTCYILLLRKN